MSETSQYVLLSFYHYASVTDPEQTAVDFREFCQSHALRGKIYIATEGINGNISGTVENTTAFRQWLASRPLFTDIWFKTDTTETFVYPKMIVRTKKELVNLGRPEVNLAHGGKRLKPEELLQFYEQGRKFIILDTRNDYESEIGHFQGAITPKIRNFRDFPAVVDSLSEHKDTTVITYCTGGIRCEKASAFMVEQGFSDVYQLDGGIISFIKKYPDTIWQGGCFVFDERKVLQPNTKPGLQFTTKCHHCGQPTASYINCHNLDCDTLFVCCDTCKDKYHYSCSESCIGAIRRRPKIYH